MSQPAATAPTPRASWREWLLVLAVTLVLGKALWDLGWKAAYELLVPYHHDNLIFFAVGQGILNDLLPYYDLYETKPPGMFLLSALSLRVTGGMLLARWLQVAVVLAFPVLTACAAATVLPDRSRGQQRWLITLAFLFGTLVSLYATVRAPAFMAESFGALFVSIYAVQLFLWQGRLRWRNVLVAGLLLMVAIGVKEPFLLSAAGVALILAPSLLSLLKIFVLPALVAGLVGSALLLALSYFVPYVFIYLPVMLAHHVHRYGSPWVRGLSVDRLAGDLTQFAWPLGALVLLLVIIALLSRRQASAGRWLASTARMVLGLYLLSVAVASGGEFHPQHFVFAVPGLVALWLVSLPYLSDRWDKLAARGGAGIISLGVILSLFVHQPVYSESALNNLGRLADKAQATAQVIDAVLDACDWDHYMYLGSVKTLSFGYTKHSPLGPGFILQYMNIGHPYFRQRFEDNVRSTDLGVVDVEAGKFLTDEDYEYIFHNFQERPWECAQGITLPDHHQFLFRRVTPDSRPAQI